MACGGCVNRQKAIQRAMDRPKTSVSKAAAYVVKSGARDLRKALVASLNKTRRK